MQRTASTIGVALLVMACGAGPTLTDGQRATVTAQVEAAVGSFLEAQQQLDADRVIGHLAPTFYMYMDGARQDFATTASQIRASMPTFQHFESRWSDVEVTVLGQNGAAVSLVFRDSIIDASGATSVLRGVSTLVWQRLGSAWRIVYADADHYPDGGAAEPT